MAGQGSERVLRFKLHCRKEVSWPLYLGPSEQPRIWRGDIDADVTFRDGAVPAGTDEGIGATIAAAGQHADVSDRVGVHVEQLEIGVASAHRGNPEKLRSGAQVEKCSRVERVVVRVSHRGRVGASQPRRVVQDVYSQ